MVGARVTVRISKGEGEGEGEGRGGGEGEGEGTLRGKATETRKGPVKCRGPFDGP